MASGSEGGPASPPDPLSMFMQQRKKDPVSPGSSKGTPSPAGATAASEPSSQPLAPASKSLLFDIESSLGQHISARRLGTEALGSDAETSPHGQLECLLAPGSNVDFPTITEICEMLSSRPAEVAGAVEILFRALGPRSLPRRRLKALTILNELVHDANVATQVRRAPGALPILQQLQGTRGTGLGAEADGQIRMFSTELERRIFQAPQAAYHSPQKISPPSVPRPSIGPVSPEAGLPASASTSTPADVFRDGHRQSPQARQAHRSSLEDLDPLRGKATSPNSPGLMAPIDSDGVDWD